MHRTIAWFAIPQLNKNTEMVEKGSTGVWLLIRCIQLIRVFTIRALAISDPKRRIKRISYICGVFNGTIVNLVCLGSHLPGMSPKRQFLYVASHPTFHRYVVETIHELTTAIINNSSHPKNQGLLCIRPLITGELACIRIGDLFKSLMSHQVQGTNPFTHQHLLLSVP